jgi:hypothetical protein
MSLTSINIPTSQILVGYVLEKLSVIPESSVDCNEPQNISTFAVKIENGEVVSNDPVG